MWNSKSTAICLFVVLHVKGGVKLSFLTHTRETGDIEKADLKKQNCCRFYFPKHATQSSNENE